MLNIQNIKRLFCYLVFSVGVAPVLASLQVQRPKKVTKHRQEEQLLLKASEKPIDATQSKQDKQRACHSKSPQLTAWQKINECVEEVAEALNPTRIWNSRNINLILKEQPTLGRSFQEDMKTELRRLAKEVGMRAEFIDYICDTDLPRLCRDEQQKLADWLQKYIPKEALEDEDVLRKALRYSAEQLARDLFDKQYAPLNRTFVKDLDRKVNRLKERYRDENGNFRLTWNQKLFLWAPKVKRIWKVGYWRSLPYPTYEEKIAEDSWEELAMLQDQYAKEKEKKWWWVGACKLVDGVINTFKGMCPLFTELEDSLQKKAIGSELWENIAATLFKAALIMIPAGYGIWQVAKKGLVQTVKDVAGPALQAITPTGLWCLAAAVGGGAVGGFAAHKVADWMGFAPRDCKLISIVVGIAVITGILVAMRDWEPQPKVYKETIKTLKALGTIVSAVGLFIGAHIVGYLVFILSDSIPWSIFSLWVTYILSNPYEEKKEAVQKRKKNFRVKKHKKKQQEDADIEKPRHTKSKQRRQMEEEQEEFDETGQQAAVDTKAFMRTLQHKGRKEHMA